MKTAAAFPESAQSGALVGGGILNLLTTGLYGCPLALYREYIQNAADAIEAQGRMHGGRVEVFTDPAKLRLRIRDNGPGLSRQAAIRALLPVGRSDKRRGSDRGFRGIGRLSGLAFAESVTFLTRSRSVSPVTCITWDGNALRTHISKALPTESAIRDSVCVESISGTGFPDHFFEVQIGGIGRYAAAQILNRETVRHYLSEVSPAPFSTLFPFKREINQYLGRHGANFTLQIMIDGESPPVTRGYEDCIPFSQSKQDTFSEVERFRIPSPDGTGIAAIGWIAHSSYLGAIPKGAGIRGIRAREGNIQVGDETLFDHLFPEERFNRWCVGEVHILDPRVIPNARRDYFEPGPHIRHFENQLASVLQDMATNCRRASSSRNSSRRASTALIRMEEAYELASSGYLADSDTRALVDGAISLSASIRCNGLTEGDDGRTSQLDDLVAKLQEITPERDPPLFNLLSKAETRVCRKLFGILAQVAESPGIVKEVAEAMLAKTPSK